jgi:pimeloyl-ACP methyl ester carboxylesterase
VPRLAVVVCNPFGEEALRAHRIYRVLARKLAQEGIPVLRFDYSGSGDSMGDSGSVSLAAWTKDVGAAVGELRKQSKASEVALFGLGLGGSIAALASSETGVRRVIAWDPVIDGRAYLRELAVSHVRYMESELGRPLTPPAEDFVPREALGHPLSERMIQELSKLHLVERPSWGDHVKLNVLWTGETSPEARALRATLSEPGAWLDVASSTPWNSDAALNSAVVPMDVIEAAISVIQPSTSR